MTIDQIIADIEAATAKRRKGDFTHVVLEVDHVDVLIAAYRAVCEVIKSNEALWKLYQKEHPDAE